MGDNRFGYMRKHLGFSQKDASRIFSTRLDTIKKWDSGKLLLPAPVLEEMFDYVSTTRDLVEQFANEIECEDFDDPIDEIYLKTFSADELDEIGLPPSVGWLENTIGAIIAALPSKHVYGATIIPEHYDPDFCWFDFWRGGSPNFRAGYVVKDEAVLRNEIYQQLHNKSVRVEFDTTDSHYFIGFTTKTVANAERVIWIKACHGGKYAELTDHWKKGPPTFYDSYDNSTPYIKGGDGPVHVGFATETEGDSVDVYSLAEVIFEELSTAFESEVDLRLMCRKILGDLVGSKDDYTSELFNEWDVKDTRFVSHKFITGLFFETQKQTGLILHPEVMVELCSSVAKSEPAIQGIDNEVIVIDVGGMLFSITLDLRDILVQSGDGREFRTEAGNALDIIEASIANESLTLIEPYSKIEVNLMANRE